MRLPGICVSVLLVLAGYSAVTRATASQQILGSGLVGTWDLVSLEDRRPNGQVLYWMGRNPSGTIIYTAAGRVAAQVMRDPRPTFSATPSWSPDSWELLPTVSAAEAREAYTGYYAYFGAYEVDASAQTVTHHVQASLRPNEVGTAYVRKFELTGDQLILRVAVNVGHEARTRVLTWRRAARS